jgi:ribonuclease-3
MSVSSTHNADISILCERIGVSVGSEILERALTHRSYSYENGGIPTNERLEFLGDSVLGIVVTDTLYRRHPDLPEGQLAKLRAAVVNMRALADIGRGFGLGEFIRLGKGEETTGGRDKSSIVADTVEALLGAVYIDQGLAVAAELIHHLFDGLIAAASSMGAGLDWKTSLQELAALRGVGVPRYSVTESGPDHQKSFVATVHMGEGDFGQGQGKNKKEAEQAAAQTPWQVLNEQAETLPASE